MGQLRDRICELNSVQINQRKVHFKLSMHRYRLSSTIVSALTVYSNSTVYRQTIPAQCYDTIHSILSRYTHSVLRTFDRMNAVILHNYSPMSFLFNSLIAFLFIHFFILFNSFISCIFIDSFHFRLRNPECFNLDKRNLDVCPLIKGENKLRLLNYQNNKISVISNLENLSDLIFLDFYNNNLKSLGGSLSWVPGMIGTWIS